MLCPAAHRREVCLGEFLTALALMLAIEGLCFAAFPEAMKKAMRDAAEIPGRSLRMIGFVSAIIGIGLVWASRGFPLIKIW
jgi:uncharacterized protein